jgi:hypothetical protein
LTAPLSPGDVECLSVASVSTGVLLMVEAVCAELQGVGLDPPLPVQV